MQEREVVITDNMKGARW